jgi:hypothetical protein
LFLSLALSREQRGMPKKGGEMIELTKEQIEKAAYPISVKQAIDDLQELYEWASQSVRGFEARDLVALNAAIQVLKLLQ